MTSELIKDVEHRIISIVKDDVSENQLTQIQSIFEELTDPFWSEENQERLRKSIASKTTVHDLIEVEDD